jgi:hypothetical protein
LGPRAFDNVDVDRLLAGPIDAQWAEWIGRHLMLNGRALDAYLAGQAIVAREFHGDVVDGA